jgi:hypothetical protein
VLDLRRRAPNLLSLLRPGLRWKKDAARARAWPGGPVSRAPHPPRLFEKSAWRACWRGGAAAEPCASIRRLLPADDAPAPSTEQRRIHPSTPHHTTATMVKVPQTKKAPASKSSGGKGIKFVK